MDDSSGFNPLGMDPGLARNLMAFGAATMQGANARTPQGFLANGPGALGAIGAGILGMQNQQLAYSQLGSENNLRAAQAEHERANTALTQMQIPFMQQQMDMLRNLPLLGGSSPGAVPPVGEPGQSFGGNPAPIPVGQRAAMVNDAVNGTNIPPQIFGSLVDQESAWDTNAVSKAGARGLAQVLPSTAQQPGFGMQGIDPQTLLGPQNAATNLKFGAQYLNTLAAQEGIKSPADWATNPEAAARALARYNSGVPNPTADNGVYASTILARAKKGWSGISAGNAMAAPGGVGTQIAQAGNGPVPLPGNQPPQQPQQPAPFAGMPSPQEAYQRAQQYYSIAQRLAGAPMLQGMAKQYSDQASQLMQFALHPYELRQGGMAVIPGVGVLKNPDRVTVQNSDGSTGYAYTSPASPFAPPGTAGETSPVTDANGNPVLEKQGFPVQQQSGAYASFAHGKESEEFDSAQGTQGWLTQLDHSAQVLSQNKGFLSLGPNAPERFGFANNVNDLLRSAGLPAAFDPNSVAMWEEMKKATTTAGFELSSHYEGHSRQAASTIINATSAIPSVANSPAGYQAVSSGVHEVAQMAIDLRNFKQPIYNAGGDLVKADTDFFKQFSPQMYTRRAISTVNPYTVKGDAELQNYLPGTYIRYLPKGASQYILTQVPERPGMPPIPDYLKPGTAINVTGATPAPQQ